MAKITDLAAVEAITGDEFLPIVQRGATKRATMSALRALIVPYLQAWYKGDKGDTGPANNTVSTIARLTSAADPTQETALVADALRGGAFAYVAGDFSAKLATDPRRGVIVPAKNDPQAQQGAWVRIDGGKIDARWFGAVGDGVTDDTAAIQAALDFAGSLTIADPPFEGFGYVLKGGASVYLPAAPYRTTAPLEIPQNVSFEGAGKHSTILLSTSPGHVLRNRATATVQGSYDRSGHALRNFSIIGDRSKPNQVGIGLLRMMAGRVENVHVSKCGSHGMELLQIGNSTFDNVECVLNGGHGLEIGRGKDDWGQADNMWPSNANVFNFYGGLQNDGAGIHFRLGTNGNVFIGGVCQYNFLSAGDNNGFQVLSETDSYLPNLLIRLWTEGPCDSHVAVLHNDASTGIILVDWGHFGHGETGNVNRALTVTRGTARVVRPASPANKYRKIGGSTAPFRIDDLGTGIIELVDPSGAGMVTTTMVEGPDRTRVGLENNLRVRGLDAVFGVLRHIMTAGAVASDEWLTDTSDQPYLRIEPFHKAMAFGDGITAPDAMLKRLAPGMLGLDNRGRMQTFRAGVLATEPVTVANLPAVALPALPGRRAFVTDSTVALEGHAGAAVAGGGNNVAPVYHDGANWRLG